MIQCLRLLKKDEGEFVITFLSLFLSVFCAVGLEADG